ncbi:Calpain-type cysteine protease DEK1 (Phytocalpain DEK1) (Protein DEFECTIVE KERNEL 1) (ZmDEK1) [Durusdinium trenchii]|uniref:Calpain-type cysteine protease DEK1 (Phytocalpain DEK1) (Protein DEFECTIVE KERNEL 1) (ZmDEK1) n=1 Tax=Durusdinium trenchii TaxID=1381693 RepID=A0ABP0KS25_9DINO
MGATVSVEVEIPDSAAKNALLSCASAAGTAVGAEVLGKASAGPEEEESKVGQGEGIGRGEVNGVAADRLLVEFNRQLQRPMDGSDMGNILAARDELHRLRFLLSCSNSHQENSMLIESGPDAETVKVQLAHVRVPVPAPTDEPQDPASQDMLGGFRRLGTDIMDFLGATERSTDLVFTDHDFPPERSSLCRDWSKLSAGEQETWATYEWRRIGTLTPDSAEGPLFDGGISPNDIHQGQLGDCYFLSSLAVLAEFPGLIKKLFAQDQQSSKGSYGVRMCLNGTWEDVVVDDKVPFDPRTDAPAFARPKAGAEKWVLILEKAWAKVNGDYQNIIGGDPGQMLRTLTGARTERLDMADPKLVWDSLVLAEQSGFVQTATIYEKPGDLQATVGIVENHAYAILGIFETRFRGRALKLLKIRNPWGNFEWKGDWSDASPLWSQELKQLVHFTDEDDGTFHMSLEDFGRVFSVVHICHTRSDQSYVSSEQVTFCKPLQTNSTASMQGLSPNRRACAKLEISSRGAYTICVHQQDKRGLAEDDPLKTATYVAVRFWLVKVDLASGEFSSVAASSYTRGRDVYIEDQVLASGTYLVFVTGTADHDVSTAPFVCSVSGREKAEISVLHSGLTQAAPQKGWQEASSTMIQAYKAWTLSSGKSFDFGKWNEPNIRMLSWNTQQEGVVSLLYQNDSSVSTLKETVTLKLDNLGIVFVTENCSVAPDVSEVTLTVEPGSHALILIEQLLPDKGFKYSYSRSFNLVK